MNDVDSHRVVQMKAVQAEALELFTRKNTDYGDAFAKYGVIGVLMRIEDKLLTSGQREITTEYLGGLVMAELKKLDKVAYVRFASVYKSFEDIGEFVEAIREMQGPPTQRKG